MLSPVGWHRAAGHFIAAFHALVKNFLVLLLHSLLFLDQFQRRLGGVLLVILRLLVMLLIILAHLLTPLSTASGNAGARRVPKSMGYLTQVAPYSPAAKAAGNNNAKPPCGG